MTVQIPVKQPQSVTKKDLLTIDEAAVEFSVCQKTVRNWIANGTIRAKQFDRLWRIPRSEIERLSRASNSVLKFYLTNSGSFWFEYLYNRQSNGKS